MAHSSTHSSISTNRPVAPSPRAAVTALHGAGGWLVLLPLATLVLQSTILLGMNFPQNAPIDWWPVSFVCLVPWTLFVVGVRRRRVAYAVAYLTGVAFFLINIHYIWFITPAGYVALSFYLGLLHALVALAIRPAYLRWRIPLAILLPILWVGAEFARGSGPLAFPFLLLAHGVYRQLALIQISDVFGAYGVSFVIVMVNGLIADTVIHWLARRRAVETGRRLMPAVIATLVVLCATLLYGGVQLSRQTVSDGPKIAVLQGDYPLYVDPELERPSEASKAITYFDLLHQASVQQPDLYLLPETPWAMVLNAEFLSATDFPVRPAMYEELQRQSRFYDEAFERSASAYNASIVVGAASMEFPEEHYPSSRKYNSAFVYMPRASAAQRYDKVNLVMFGEYTPFRYGRLHALYRWLDSFNPFSSPEDEFSLTAGSEFRVFALSVGGGRTYHFGVPICFEDLIPRVSREFSGGFSGRPAADFLLSISNDGWFNHGSMVPQHLAVCVFRAVENRVGIARSVNTACSGFVDPDGRIHHVVNDHGRTLGPGIFGFEVANVKIDSRRSLYTLLGDWFGALCAVLSVVLLLGARVYRRRGTDRESGGALPQAEDSA